MRTRNALLALTLIATSGCHKSAPPIRFAPSDTDIARLRSEYALTPAERAARFPARSYSSNESHAVDTSAAVMILKNYPLKHPE